MSITALVIVVYLAFFVAFGIYLNKSNVSASDWAIGGGGLGMRVRTLNVACPPLFRAVGKKIDFAVLVRRYAVDMHRR